MELEKKQNRDEDDTIENQGAKNYDKMNYERWVNGLKLWKEWRDWA